MLATTLILVLEITIFKAMFFLELYNNLSIMFDIYLIVSKARTTYFIFDVRATSGSPSLSLILT